ncbi:MAG TPA: universal stress protein [Ktedonobacterales bacterium]
MTHDSTDSLTSGAGASAQPQAGGEGASQITPFRVLVPLDGSDMAAQALPVATSICAQIPGSELILLRVLLLTPLTDSMLAGPQFVSPDVYLQMSGDEEQVAREYLEAAAKGVSRPGVRYRTYVERGTAADVIRDVAAAQQVSLIVMTTHGRTGVARLALGSIADSVVRGGVAPVLLLRSFQTQEWSDTTLRHALVPLDGSPLSEAPLAGIVPQLAGTVIQEVTLLHVVDPSDDSEAIVRAETYLAQVESRLKERLGEKPCAIHTLVRSGPVAATIIDCAEAAKCGVIIMSTRGEAGIARLAFGGVTDHVLRDGHTPLLLVHPHE